MKKLSLENAKTVVGGAHWYCGTCRYTSHYHVFLQTAKGSAYDHEKRTGHGTRVFR